MRTLRTRSNLLLAAAAWTFYVWGTRMWNIASDPAHDLGFKAVHALLALVSVAFGVALAVVGLRMRREAAGRRPADPAGDRERVTP
ncbi:MAG TPA: hypothetical protein VFC13_24175 [Actinomycetes bacterium]|jgi:hypothetical protein|nr:hypothetical protein [Actinomycetes bacterium]